MTGIHFTDPGAIIDDEWANAEDVLGALRGMDAAITQISRNLHAGRLSNHNLDPVAWEFGGANVLYLHPYVGNASLNRREDGSYVVSTIPYDAARLSVAGFPDGLWDVFEYDEAGVVTLEAERWASHNVRGYTLMPDPALGYVKPTDPTRKWRGVIWTLSGIIWQQAFRQSIYNAFNRCVRVMARQATGATWSPPAPGAWIQGLGIPTLSFIVPFAGMSAWASYMVGISSADALTRIGIAVSPWAFAYDRQITAQIGATSGHSLCVSGRITFNEGYRLIAHADFKTTNATFVGQLDSGLTLVWEC